MRLTTIVIATPLLFLAPSFSVSSGRDGERLPAYPSSDPNRRVEDHFVDQLSDKDAPLGERGHAALMLGRMRSKLAIHCLIANITLRYREPPPEEKIISIDSSQECGGPCVTALKRYGKEVLAPLVRAYLDAPKQYGGHDGRFYWKVADVQFELLSILKQDAKSRDHYDAIRFIRSYGSSLNDQSDLKELFGLYRTLHDLPHQCQVPSDWPMLQ